MKKVIKIIPIILLGVLLSFSTGIYAQGGPENPPGDPGVGDDPIGGGGGAPVGSGVALLLILGGAYATGKTVQLRKKK